jgi:hypothetical protein
MIEKIKNRISKIEMQKEELMRNFLREKNDTEKEILIERNRMFSMELFFLKELIEYDSKNRSN